MNYIPIPRRYRPKVFDEVVGQDHIIISLKNAIKNNRIVNAYLFAGPRGTGKTTVARILAKALNCKSSNDIPTTSPCNNCINCTQIDNSLSLDVLEIDGASNRGIDEVRQLRERIKVKPVTGRYKIYIIDEVHMLTEQAFNALLKTLEEPPPHVVFVLATTEAHKLPLTIISRCQRFDFRKIPTPQITAHLKKILKKEGVIAEENSLILLSKGADGSLRDAEALLEQAILYSQDEIIKAEQISNILGIIKLTKAADLLEALLNNDITSALDIIEQLISGGYDLMEFIKNMLYYFMYLLLFKMNYDKINLELSEEEREAVAKHANKLDTKIILKSIDNLKNVIKEMKLMPNCARVLVDIEMIKLLNLINQENRNNQDIQSIWEKIKTKLKKEEPLLNSCLSSTKFYFDEHQHKIILKVNTQDYFQKEMINKKKSILEEYINKELESKDKLFIEIEEYEEEYPPIVKAAIELFNAKQVKQVEES